MALGHVRAHDHDVVRVGQGLLEVGGAAASERGPETRDRGAVSYARLVLDLHGPHRREELLDEVVLLVVERRAAEMREPEGALHANARVVLVLPARGARGDHAVGDHVHRLVELELLPLGAVRAAVLDLVLAHRALHHLLARRALRTEAAARDRAVGVTLDLRHLAVLHVDELGAADGAVGADRLHHLVRLAGARREHARDVRLRRTTARGRIHHLAHQGRQGGEGFPGYAAHPPARVPALGAG